MDQLIYVKTIFFGACTEILLEFSGRLCKIFHLCFLTAFFLSGGISPDSLFSVKSRISCGNDQFLHAGSNILNSESCLFSLEDYAKSLKLS